jgi:ATP-dependent DNA helicase RecQ
MLMETGDLSKLARPENVKISTGDRIEALRELRKTLAQKRGVAPFTIFQDTTLEILAHEGEKIKDINGLLDINGMTMKKVFDFGEDIVACLQKPVSSGKGARDAAPAPKNAKTEEKTYHLLKQGYSFGDIAKQRGIKKQTVETHVALLIERGKHRDEGYLDYDRFMSEDIFQTICTVVSKSKHTGKLRALKDQLPGNITYAQIKVALAHYKYNKKH